MSTAMVADQRQRVNAVTFTLPDLPPSTNELMAPTRPNIHSNAQRWEIKPEWKQWRSTMLRYVKVLDIAKSSIVRVDLWFFYDWYYKNGELKRMDSQNLINFAVNTVAAKQSWDDKVCKHGSWGSTHDAQRPRVAVRLTEMPNMVRVKGGELVITKTMKGER